MTDPSKPHAPGLFGYINGIEVQFSNPRHAGEFGSTVATVTARRADIPAGTPEVMDDRSVAADLMVVSMNEGVC